MGVEVWGHRAEPEGEHRGEGRGQAHHQQRVQRQELPVGHGHGDLGEAGERERDPDSAGNDQDPAAEPVEQAADGQTEQPHRETARHHEEPGLQGLSARMFCRYNGSRIIEPSIAMKDTAIRISATV